jgi:preprotein translocase subunit YajC
MLSIALQILAIGAIFYWLLIKPQRDERKRHQAMVASLKKGDEVATVGGILGTIVHVEEDRVTLKTAENTRLVVERQKVSRTVAPGAAS